MAGVAVTSPQQPVLKSALKKSSTLPRPRKRQVVIDEARNTYCEAVSFYTVEAPALARSCRAKPAPLTAVSHTGQWQGAACPAYCC